MILLLGGSGYVGSAFRDYFTRNSISFRSIARQEVDYYSASQLRSFIDANRPAFLINAAGYTGKPNVDACEIYKTECVLGNVVLPGLLKGICQEFDLPWGHVSSGCIFTGNTPDGRGFTEQDAPNFCFRTNNCSFYSGCKALGEECVVDAEQTYLWRLRIPFNHIDSPRNYLSKILRYERLLEATNSISRLDEFVRACYLCYEHQLPYGTYNITNPGAITTREVAEIATEVLALKRTFSYFSNEAEFMHFAAKTPRSNCVLDSSKILSYGISLTNTRDALYDALRNWIPEKR
jgi:dTDP-4-dehydrorhamnose reductase